jgi:glutathione S-transferase
LSQTGKIPALADGDFVVSDSAAICAYFERLQPTPSVYGASPQAYAQSLSLEQYGGTLFREVVHPLFHEVFVHPKVRGVATDQKRIDAVLKDAVPETFGYLDSVAGGDYLVGSSLTVADIAIGSNLITYQDIGFDLYRDRFPRLAQLFDRVVRHPAMNEAIKREQPAVAQMGLRKDFFPLAA